MHRALVTYYKFRGMFNSGELDRVEAENRISGRKLARLQDHFTEAVGGITGMHTSSPCRPIYRVTFVLKESE